MASLRYSQIRATPGGCLNYIDNKEKMLSPGVHNIHNVLAYMGAEESVERVYACARHCSTNPTLAAAQMELFRTRYYESKQGGVQGLQEGRAELLGLHMFLSYTETDQPSEETMNAITEALAQHPLLQDFPVFSANHFDKSHRHTHIYISQYSAAGTPRKLCMRRRDYDDLRKYINRLCVHHNLSIIDLPSLRHGDPQYSAWIDGVIAAGKVIVHPESEEHKGSRHQKVSTKKIYYKCLRAQKEFNAKEEARLTAAQLSAKKAEETYYWRFDSEPRKKLYLISNDPKKRYYAVRRYDEQGRQRTLVELICMLIIVIYRNEMARRVPPSSPAYLIIRARVDKNVQCMMDCIRTSREMHAATPAEVAERLADTGTQMNALRQEQKRLEALPQEEQTQEQLRFHQQKILDYERRLKELRRRYRGLKRLQALISNPERIVEHSYHYQPTVSLDDHIRLAVNTQKNKNHETTKNKSRSDQYG